jgi:LmbE family N-acetylglucosaminyl deacetylase
MLRTLLLIFAHPDDEAFLTGGTASKYADEGARVVLVTATRGESGKVGEPPLYTREELPAVREGELRRAAAILGISEVHLLGYRDRELAAAPPDQIREQLVSLIRRYRPSVAVTFNPDGGNLHPDHLAISRFTSDAVAAASDPRWFPSAGLPHAIGRLAWPTARHPWRLVREAELSASPGADFVIDVNAWSNRKAAALRAHATQHESTHRHFFSQPDCERLLSLEVFRQAIGPRLTTRPLTGLFDALD